MKFNSREVVRDLPVFSFAGGVFMGDGSFEIAMTESDTQAATIPDHDNPPSRAFLSYPASTLSPPIVPTDLSSFKSRGIAEVERDLQQKLTELREEYLRAIDHFNWNKLVYEAEIRFEPIVGGTYHLYEMRGRRALSMISPDQWPHKHLATVRLNVDRQWRVVETGDGIDSKTLFFSA